MKPTLLVFADFFRARDFAAALAAAGFLSARVTPRGAGFVVECPMLGLCHVTFEPGTGVGV